MNVPGRERRSPPAGLALIAAVAAVSWAAILVRLCEAPSLGIAFYRLLFATAVLLPWGLRPGGPVSPRTYGLAAASGCLLALHFATWISSLSLTTVASSVVLVSMQPVFTAVLGPFFLEERPGRAGLAAMALALGGTLLLAGGDLLLGGSAVLGDLLAVAGALAASAYLMIGRGVRERIGFARYLLVVCASASGSLALLALLWGARLHGYPPVTWLWLVLLAAGPHLLGHGLLNWSVRRLPAFVVNLAILGEPVLATVYAALLFEEIPSLSFYGGAALVVAGVLLAGREAAGVGAR